MGLPWEAPTEMPTGPGRRDKVCGGHAWEYGELEAGVLSRGDSCCSVQPL